MTTTVTIDAHAGWPVKVESIDTDYETGVEKTSLVEIVSPGEIRHHAVWDTRKLLITELTRDDS